MNADEKRRTVQALRGFLYGPGAGATPQDLDAVDALIAGTHTPEQRDRVDALCDLALWEQEADR